VVHNAGAAEGTFTNPVFFKASTTSYQDSAGDAVSRWGDYSSAAADPNHPNGFLISNEYANGAHSWATAVAQIIVPIGLVA
jgi:hypothetical protein